MIEIEHNKNLKPFNTLRIPICAKYFIRITSEADVHEYLGDPKLSSLPRLTLGEGSNVLFTEDFDGVVLKNEIKGHELVGEDAAHVVWELGAGEHWHSVVERAVAEGLYGIEALALIPGTVGAAPVQNIAAYGQSFENSLHSLDACELQTGVVQKFFRKDAEFSYRSSIFKKKKNEFFILRVRMALYKSRSALPEYASTGTRRDSLSAELQTFATEPYTAQDVCTAVMNIRKRKLIDVHEAPTAGSFFLNPVVSVACAKELAKKVPDLQWYPETGLQYTSDVYDTKEEANVKVAAARLIEALGWKGKRVGNCFVSPEHALLVTHNGNATGAELKQFVDAIKKDFFDAYGIALELELTVV